MNSKNYNAAQKHFEKEKDKISKELKFKRKKLMIIYVAAFSVVFKSLRLT